VAHDVDELFAGHENLRKVSMLFATNPEDNEQCEKRKKRVTRVKKVTRERVKHVHYV
tara:strand:- start:1646 stop:1816 length:171 start_codon:yes stop_codon:yes gene_type:complete